MSAEPPTTEPPDDDRRIEEDERRLLERERTSPLMVRAGGHQPGEDQYQRLADLLAELPLLRAPDSWRAQVKDALDQEASQPPATTAAAQASAEVPDATPSPRSAPRARRPLLPRIALATGALSVAALALLVWQLPGEEGGAARPASRTTREPTSALTPELTVELHHGEVPHRTLRTASVGDRMILRAKAAAAVRLYLEGQTLIASCPEDPRCARQGEHLTLELPLEAPGEYRAILLHGSGPPPAPSASMKDDLAAANRASFSVLSASPVQVR